MIKALFELLGEIEAFNWRALLIFVLIIIALLWGLAIVTAVAQWLTYTILSITSAVTSLVTGLFFSPSLYGLIEICLIFIAITVLAKFIMKSNRYHR